MVNDQIDQLAALLREMHQELFPGEWEMGDFPEGETRQKARWLHERRVVIQELIPPRVDVGGGVSSRRITKDMVDVSEPIEPSDAAVEALKSAFGWTVVSCYGGSDYNELTNKDCKDALTAAYRAEREEL